MGYIYIIKNNVNGLLYIGQTIRNVNIRWSEHKITSKNRLLNTSIKEFGKDNFFFYKILEIDDEKLDEEEQKLIKEYNTIYPNGYNSLLVNKFSKKDNILGGSSEIGHDRQSKKVKEKYNNIECLKGLGNIPRGISYWKGTKKIKGKIYDYHGFKIRKVGIKNKEFVISINSKTTLENILDKAKKYLLENEQRVSIDNI